MPQKPSDRPSIRGTALVRRARWLETKIADGRPGTGFDTAEYAELLWVFESLGIQFTPSDLSDKGVLKVLRPAKAEKTLEEPPRRPQSSADWVPGEPRTRRYVPGGQI